MVLKAWEFKIRDPHLVKAFLLQYGMAEGITWSDRERIEPAATIPIINITIHS
jgi:hypothetical protein